MNHRRAALYLQIPAAYCRWIGGLRWAQYGEAVEFLDAPDAGNTFAFAAEIGPFLEGFLAPGGTCPAFGTVLHLLWLIGLGDRAVGAVPGACRPRERLARPFRELKHPLRNAGALCGWIYRELPGIADPPELPGLLGLLHGGSWIPQMVMSHPTLGAMDYAEQPPVSPSDLEARLDARLDELSDEAIRHWLKFGRAPLATPGDVAIPLPPGGLLETLAQVEERPRMAGLARLVSRLEGALSLPPRRLDRDGPQADGYWDLATRGAPEQILPIQFALDDEEFLRRFAGRELLYFHRERPVRRVAREVLLVLDQGVRTWGEVRLVLAGAAMALAWQAGRRKLAVRLVTTVDGGEPVDPTVLDPEVLGQLLEASDLTQTPARSLSRVLCNDPGVPRDVVLLTHPRSLSDPEVVQAARRPEAGDATRIFAVSVDVGGEVELAEMRHGRPVALSRCRVALSDPAVAGRSGASTAADGRRSGWRGDVEPIPFPFRCGLVSPLAEPHDSASRLVDFDESGGRLLVVLRQGLLRADSIDRTEAELLPRPMVDGEVMKPVIGVIGVSGGFVAVGSRQKTPVLAHYDFTSRVCRVRLLPSIARGLGSFSWSYYPDLHSLGGRPADRKEPCLGVDLSARREEAMTTARAMAASGRARSNIPPYPSPPEPMDTRASEPWIGPTCDTVELDRSTGTLSYRYVAGHERTLTPMSDGQPALKGGQILASQQGGDVLALQMARRGALDCWFISMSRAAVIGCFSGDLSFNWTVKGWFTLSRDGRRFAMRVGPDRVEARDVPGDQPVAVGTHRERTWAHLASLGRSCLLVRELEQVGARRPHAEVLIRWDGPRLVIDDRASAQTFRQLGGAVGESRSLRSSRWTARFDLGRFVQFVEHGGLRILIDRYNQLAVLGPGDRLVAMFYLYGRESAAWMPDGTRLGNSRLIGGEPSPHAAERIAAALRAAERGEEGPR